MGIIEIQKVSKQFSPLLPPAINNIEASLPQGKFIGLVGPDGAGKTTLLRLMSGLILPSSGKILVDGFNTQDQSEPIHFLTGYMPQKFGLYEELSVMENLNLYADLRGIDPSKKNDVFQKLLAFSNLASFTKRLAKNLSGGMKQKLGLACALIKKPKILLLDEPSIGVDPISRRDLWEMVSSLLDGDLTIIWSTVYLDEAEKCDTVLLLNEGKLQFFGPPQDLTNQVKSKVFKIENVPDKRIQLKTLIKQENILDAIIQGNDLRLIVKDPTLIQDPSFKETTPRFEDAFVNLLGGTVSKESQFANNLPKIKNLIPFPIEANNLTKKFGDFVAAQDISFQVAKGEIFGLLGPNGAGKSTTFKMLCGLLSPTKGTAAINGIDLSKNGSLARSYIGYMAQKFSLYGTLTTRQNLFFFAGIYNIQNQKATIERMVEMFSLSPYLDGPTEQLPLGVKQRLSLSIATLHSPDILFLDEPTSGMDPISRREFWMHANELASQGRTIMVTTHFMDEAENCDRIALIYRGKIIHLGTSHELKKITKSNSLEDTFVKLIREYDAAHPI